MELNFKTIGTGSSGNCYLFYNNDISFIIDAGIRVDMVLKHIPDFNKFVGVFITHEHGDHSKYIKQYTDLGMVVFTTGGTASVLNLPFYNIIHYGNRVKISDFVSIVPFPVSHNAKEPCGFVIDHYGDRTLFATDCNKINASIVGVKNFIIEANHCITLMEKNELNYQAFTNHMSIDSAISYINNTKGLQSESVYFIHLSSRNAQSKMFIERSINETLLETIIPKINKDYIL